MTHKLLLADDSVTIQRVIELTFADEDIEVITVSDGQQAIDRLNTEPPDIVLADVDMPKRDGYEVAAYVKSRAKLAHIPVVLLTGAFEPIDQTRAAAAGSSDVLAKPFEPQMVINRVKQLLSRQRDDMPQEPPERIVAQAAAPPPPSADPETGAETISLDEYFDRLDAAFSNLQSPPGADASEPVAAEEDWIETQRLIVPVQAPAPPKSEPAAAPQAASAPVEPAQPAGVRSSEGDAGLRETLSPLPPPAPSAPPVASAAAAMPEPAPPGGVQAATESPSSHAAPVDYRAAAPEPAVAPPAAAAAAVATRPATNPFAELSAARAEAAAKAAAPVITEEVIEQVVSRVLERLTDRVVRETVTEIVSSTAERLVKEEIERIKAEGQ